MATHFARGILTEGRLASVRLSSACHNQARTLPEHRRTRFLASRALLAELMFMPCLAAAFTVTDTLDDTERGAGGFGSTGKM